MPARPVVEARGLGLQRPDGWGYLCGHPVPYGAHLARAKLTHARPPAHLAEDTTVGDAVRARLLLPDLRRDNDLFDAAADLFGLAVAPEAVVADLPALQQRLLTVAVAAMTPTHLILLDAVDRDLGPVDRQVLWRALGSVTRTGPTVIAGASMATAQADQVLTVPPGTSKFVP